MMKTVRTVAGAALILGAIGVALGQQEPPVDRRHLTPQPPAQPSPPVGPEILPLGDDRFRIGDLVVDRGGREIRATGAITVREGTLEYLVCAPGGKLYESLMRADVDPYHLQLALLLIGLEPRNNLRRQGDDRTPQGDPLTIHVAWETDAGRVELRAEKLVRRHYASNATMRETDWVFTGSMFREGLFAASYYKSLVAIFNDPTAIINNPQRGGSDDTFYVANPDTIPPLDTAVEIIFRAARQKEAEP